MHMKELTFALILLLQACGPLLAQTPEPVQPEAPGMLQRLTERARQAKAKVQNMGAVALGFAGAYYEDHIQPVSDGYAEWALDIKNAVWEKIQATVGNYMPLTEN